MTLTTQAWGELEYNCAPHGSRIRARLALLYPSRRRLMGNDWRSRRPSLATRADFQMM